MNDDSNADVARAAWAAASAGDVETLSQLCHLDVVWHASGRGSLSGDYRGQAAVFDYLAAIGEAADRFDSHLDEILVSKSQVAVLFHIEGRRNQKVLDTEFILLFRMDGGRIAEIWAIPRDQYEIDEFWS
jgi:ketosteroid isomerase-like protein